MDKFQEVYFLIAKKTRLEHAGTAKICSIQHVLMPRARNNHRLSSSFVFDLISFRSLLARQ